MNVQFTQAWKSKVALVTGATSGIGEALSLRLAAQGMQVIACGRRQDRLEALARRADALGAELTGALSTCGVDLRDESSVLELFAHVRKTHGGVDLLVNNAGLGRASPLVGGSTDAWREMLEVNVLGLCVCTREAVADMRRRGDVGHVIHIASMAGHRVPPMGGVYAATKFAVRALTEGLRQELRACNSAIRVSQVSPGLVETPFHDIYHGNESWLKETCAQLRILSAEDVVEAVCYILSQPENVQIHDVLMRPTGQRT